LKVTKSTLPLIILLMFWFSLVTKAKLFPSSKPALINFSEDEERS
ncbi:MAG: hypothetical protein ACI936_004231, partial [Paraglaciecola sp.]